MSGGHRRDASADPKLPKGAEAALLSILEAVPDPRNHLALVRDLSGEVRVTDVERAMIDTAYENREPDFSALPPPPAPERALRLVSVDQADDTADENTVDAEDEEVVDVRDEVASIDLAPAMDPYYDLGEIAENAPLTGHLFRPTND